MSEEKPKSLCNSPSSAWFYCALPPLGPKEKSNNPRNEDRKAEIRIIRDFEDKLIREGKAKEFLVEHGFVKQTGGLTKSYGG